MLTKLEYLLVYLNKVSSEMNINIDNALRFGAMEINPVNNLTYLDSIAANLGDIQVTQDKINELKEVYLSTGNESSFDETSRAIDKELEKYNKGE